MIQQIDAPLREDVRLLGNLLGETLKQHAGQDLFNQIEQIRALAKGARDGQAKVEKQLEKLFLNLKDEEILPLTRAFSYFLNFANIAEQYHTDNQYGISFTEVFVDFVHFQHDVIRHFRFR